MGGSHIFQRFYHCPISLFFHHFIVITPWAPTELTRRTSLESLQFETSSLLFHFVQNMHYQEQKYRFQKPAASTHYPLFIMRIALARAGTSAVALSMVSL
jgi:hypothetical protein